MTLHDVRKRNRRSLNKRQIFFIYLFLIMPGLILLFLLLLPPAGRAPEGPIDVPQDTARLHFSAAEEDLLSFTIFPRDGGSYTIVRDQGGYRLEEEPDFSLDMTVINGMVQSLLYVQSTDTVGGIKDLDLKDYGLGEGALQVIARFTQDRQIRFAIGDRIPSDIPSDYLLITGDPLLYAIGIDVRESLDYKKNLLHTIPAINFNADLIDNIRFEGEETFMLQRVAQDIWEITEPLHYPADLAQVQWLQRQISQMRLAAYIASSSTDNLARYGLENPRLRVIFSLAESIITTIPSGDMSPLTRQVESQELIIAIGDEIPGIGFYCLYNDTIYQASDLSMGFLPNHGISTYIGKNPIDIPLNRLTRLTISRPQSIIGFAVSLVEHILPNNDIALDEQGNILYDYLITSNGQDVVPAEFGAAYAKLLAIKASGFLSADFSAHGEPPAFSLSLHFENRERQIAFYSYDALHLAMEINGHFMYYISTQSAESAVLSLEAFTD